MERTMMGAVRRVHADTPALFPGLNSRGAGVALFGLRT